MKKLKISIPRRLLRLPFRINIILWLICTLLISVMLFSLFFVQGMSRNIHTNTVQNYQSHLTVYSPQHSPINTKNIQTWWQEPSTPIEQSIPSSSIRAITKRSSLPALYQNKNFPIYITLIGTQDHKVFNPYMSETTSTAQIPLNGVFISRGLAERLELSVGDPFPIYIPQHSYTQSNLTVSYIFEANDTFYHNYGVYLNELTLKDLFGGTFESYHIRFYVSPFIFLLNNPITSVITGQPYYYTDDRLEYQYLQLNTMRDQVHIWTYMVYMICGLILCLGSLLAHYHTVSALNQYTYRIGLAPSFSLSIRIILTVLLKIMIATTSAWILIILVLGLDLNFHSPVFTNASGLYPEWSLPLTNTFKLRIPYQNLFSLIPLGILLSLISSGILIFCYNVLPLFQDPKNKISNIVIGIILILIGGVMTSRYYLTLNFMDDSRKDFWKDHFYDDFTLYQKDYIFYHSFKLSPQQFTLSPDLLTMFSEQEVNYLAGMETFGEAKIVTNTPSETVSPLYLKKDISIKSIMGTSSRMPSILPFLQSNQIVIGKDIADYFLSNKALSLSIKNSLSTNTETSILVSHIIDLPIGDFNNTIFINHTNLSSFLKVPPHTFSKITTRRNKELLALHTNENIVLSTTDQNTKEWSHLSRLSLKSVYLSSIIQNIYLILLIMSIILLLHIASPEYLMLQYQWGIRNHTMIFYSFLGVAGLILGIMTAWLSQLYGFFVETLLDIFLQLGSYTLQKDHLSFNWTAAPLLGLGILIMYGIILPIFLFLYRRTNKILFLNHIKNKNS